MFLILYEVFILILLCQQVQQQELSLQQVSTLLAQLKLYAPLLGKAQELEEYENLQKVIIDILHLFQDVLEAIDKYNEKHLLGKLRSRATLASLDI